MADWRPGKDGVSSMGRTHLPVPAFNPPGKPKRNKYALASSFLASTTFILVGYDIGVMSGAIIYIQKDLHISDVQKEVLVGILNFYALLAAAVAARTSDWLGRRYNIVFAGALFFASALLMGFATNYAFLMVGRFVAGVALGYALTVAPVYTAEVAPTSSRGFLTSFAEVFINFGILLSYVSNYAFAKLPTNLGWRFMLGIAAVPSLFLAVGILAMPESPRWLVMHGRLGEAKQVLNQISNSPEESKLRLSEIKKAASIPENCEDNVVSVPKQQREGVWRDLLFHPTPTVRHMLMCAMGLHFFQQASGMDAVVLYSPEIFGKAGIKKDTDKLLATMVVGFTKMVFVFVATFLLDKIGRRPLLLSSMVGVILSSLSLGIWLTIIEHSDDKLDWALALCIATVLAYVAFFSIGIGPIPLVYGSEIFPLKLRAQGCSMGVVANQVTSGLVSVTFISLYKAISIQRVFFLYAGVASVGWVFFYTLYPETRGRTLEEMESLFGNFFKWRSTARALKENKGESNGEVQLGNTTNDQS
ncbi:hypothetical protein BUALT_Bualt19G0116200 [Buddleja alternifolia]|uniref:Major facilitator superfamily (MFS) profile domain-containing protein n=1 Tax=Buddleja alternifolia TaxID=168488 RepID=A0AAV6W702_9LAMI|nr:hypothetical protein BUALT_Bualt19G0116200 [Buddleja alternifolia]